MRVELREVAKGRRGEALPPTSVTFASGSARLALAETEQRPTVLGLIASGRMVADTGSVAIDGRADAADLRRRVALVDAPDVCDPAPDVTVAGVAAEELMFAGCPSNPISARRWLEASGFGSLARTPIGDVSARERIALLLELTALRRGVEGMVLVSPDRHGGHPGQWWELVEEFAARGFAMLVVAGEASATVLDGRAARADAAPDTAPAGSAPVGSGPASGAVEPAAEPLMEVEVGPESEEPAEAEPGPVVEPGPDAEAAAPEQPAGEAEEPVHAEPEPQAEIDSEVAPTPRPQLDLQPEARPGPRSRTAPEAHPAGEEER